MSKWDFYLGGFFIVYVLTRFFSYVEIYAAIIKVNFTIFEYSFTAEKYHLAWKRFFNFNFLSSSFFYITNVENFFSTRQFVIFHSSRTRNIFVPICTNFKQAINFHKMATRSNIFVFFITNSYFFPLVPSLDENYLKSCTVLTRCLYPYVICVPTWCQQRTYMVADILVYICTYENIAATIVEKFVSLCNFHKFAHIESTFAWEPGQIYALCMTKRMHMYSYLRYVRKFIIRTRVQSVCLFFVCTEYWIIVVEFELEAAWWGLPIWCEFD